MKIIKADRIITGDGKTVLENGAVALEGSRIAAVGELSGLTARWPNAPVETMDGCTLLPGLIDMHVHISGLYRRPEKQEMQENPAYLMLMVYKHLQDALGVGITTLRGVGGAKGIGAAVRGGYRKGFIKGPRYITCERSLTRTGGHGSTGEVAKILEMDDEIGLVAEGYCADLLLVEGDPSQDINALDNVRQVYRAGELLVNKA